MNDKTRQEAEREIRRLECDKMGLVDILQVGSAEDYFYYVMELADRLARKGGFCSAIR